MNRQAVIDGIVDTKTFIDLVEMAVGQARRYQFFVSLLIIDTWQLCPLPHMGMRSGLIAKVAQLIRERLRETDAITVFDDRMLLVLLPYSDKLAAVKIASRLREWLQDFFHTSGAVPRLPISIGVASYPSVISDVSGLFEHAMNCLAKAKGEGRRTQGEGF